MSCRRPLLFYTRFCKWGRKGVVTELALAANSNRPALSENPNIDLPGLSCPSYSSGVTRRVTCFPLSYAIHCGDLSPVAP